jgi:hypothetical protein
MNIEELEKKFKVTFRLLRRDRMFEKISNFIQLEKLNREELPLDWLSFLPMWIRSEGGAAELIEVAYFESIVQQQKRFLIDGVELRHFDFFHLNPTLQEIKVSGGAKALGVDPGLYLFCIYKNESYQLKVSSLTMKWVDRLREDLVFTEAELETSEDRKIFQNLLAAKVILPPFRDYV